MQTAVAVSHTTEHALARMHYGVSTEYHYCAMSRNSLYAMLTCAS